MRKEDLTGKKYNLLTVEGLDCVKDGVSYWKCRCDCGNVVNVRGNNLKSGAVKSCGCLRKIPSNFMHGESKTKLYRHWISMIYRCTNPKKDSYKWYGARGISVCEEWKTFEGFKAWAMKTRPDESFTVERIDVNGDYCPENCKWIPAGDQADNRRTNIVIEHNGQKKNLAQWCDALGLDYKRIHNRMFRLGWDFEKAISCPVDSRKQNKKG